MRAARNCRARPAGRFELDGLLVPGSDPVAEEGSQLILPAHQGRQHVSNVQGLHLLHSAILHGGQGRVPANLPQGLIPVLPDRCLSDPKDRYLSHAQILPARTVRASQDLLKAETALRPEPRNTMRTELVHVRVYWHRGVRMSGENCLLIAAQPVWPVRLRHGAHVPPAGTHPGSRLDNENDADRGLRRRTFCHPGDQRWRNEG